MFLKTLFSAYRPLGLGINGFEPLRICEQQLVKQVMSCIDETSNARCNRQPESGIGVFQCCFRPLILSFTQHGSVIVDRNGHGEAMIRVACGMMAVISRAPLCPSSALCADRRVSTSDQGKWTTLTAFAFAPNPYTSRGDAPAGGISIGPRFHEDLAYRDSNERKPSVTEARQFLSVSQ